MTRAFAVALLALASGASAAAAEAPRTGEQIFVHRCGMCHREGGTGTFILARRLGADRSLLEKRSDLQPDYVRYVVRYGLVNMPRISRVELPDADFDLLMRYLAKTP